MILEIVQMLGVTPKLRDYLKYWIQSRAVENQISIREADDVPDTTLNPNYVYFIDGDIDLSGTSKSFIVGPLGARIRGLGSDKSFVRSTSNNHTLVKTVNGGGGNLFLDNLTFVASGTNSKVFDMEDVDGTHAIEMQQVNFENCTSLGEWTDYRQGLEINTGRFGGTPELTLSGDMGGYRQSTALVRGLVGDATLFKEGTNLLFEAGGRFRTDGNIQLSDGSAFCDFNEANFSSDRSFEINGAIFSGLSDAYQYLTNISISSTKAFIQDSVGLPNTYPGIFGQITTEVETEFSSSNTPLLIGGVGTYTNETWFSGSSSLVVTYLATIAINNKYRVDSNITLQGANGRDFTIYVRQWDDSESSYLSPNIVSAQGTTSNRGTYSISKSGVAVLDTNDRIEVWLENNSDATGMTIIEGSSLFITKI